MCFLRRRTLNIPYRHFLRTAIPCSSCIFYRKLFWAHQGVHESEDNLSCEAPYAEKHLQALKDPWPSMGRLRYLSSFMRIWFF